MTAIRRYFVVLSLMLWQGGFLFYSAFVVPVGTEILGTAAAQGAITARVTDTLNLCSLPALALLAWDQAVSRDPRKRRTALRWCGWGIAGGCQIALFVVHQMLDSLMNPDRTYVVIHPPFRPLHRIYLWTSTVQWGASLILIWMMIRAWNAESSLTPTVSEPAGERAH